MNRIQPFISIIIPTYNRPAQLKSCLESIACLDYSVERFEVVVVDDGSRMCLEPIVSPFRRQMQLTFLVQRNSGPGVARNNGTAKAKGRLLVFTDDDCMPAVGWLAALAARFVQTPDHAIGGRTMNALPENPYSAASQAIMDFVYAHYNADPDHARFFASNNLAVPADRFRLVGGFDRGWRLAASEDRQLCDRWLHSGYRMTYAPEAVVFHAHALTLGGFWRQHFNYGRGAFRFHQGRARRGSGPFGFELRFYTKLLGYDFLYKNTRILPMLAVWQLANTVGFFSEMSKFQNRRAAMTGEQSDCPR